MTQRDEARRRELFAELQVSRSEHVRNELVESYVPLAEYFAKRYQDRGVEQADLRQVAQLALIKAVDRFDPSVGVQFSTFAGRTIDGEIKRYFRDKTWAVRVPRSLQELSIEVRHVIEQLSSDLGRSPTVDEIAAMSGIATDQVLEALDAQTAYRATSTDRPLAPAEDGTTVGEALRVEEEGFRRAEVGVAMGQLIETLPDRERTIVEMSFFREMTQSDIAAELGISQMHVSRLLRRSLQQLRARLSS